MKEINTKELEAWFHHWATMRGRELSMGIFEVPDGSKVRFEGLLVFKGRTDGMGGEVPGTETYAIRITKKQALNMIEGIQILLDDWPEDHDADAG